MNLLLVLLLISSTGFQSHSFGVTKHGPPRSNWTVTCPNGAAGEWYIEPSDQAAEQFCVFWDDVIKIRAMEMDEIPEIGLDKCPEDRVCI